MLLTSTHYNSKQKINKIKKRVTMSKSHTLTTHDLLTSTHEGFLLFRLAAVYQGNMIYASEAFSFSFAMGL